MLAAFAKAVKTANQRAFRELWWLLKQAMSAFSEQELGKNGRQLRDLSVEDFFARVFDLVMMQVMVPGQHRDDDKHCDGGASVLTLLQNDPELPQTATDMKKRYKYDRATETAKAKSSGTKLQLMGNAGGGRTTGANGLDALQRAPAMLAAFAKAVK